MKSIKFECELPQNAEILIHCDGTWSINMQGQVKVEPIKYDGQFGVEKKKNYTLFCESGDDYIITRGKDTINGLTLREYDEKFYPTAVAGWAKFKLEHDSNLTEDDIEVLNLIVQGKLPKKK